MPRSAKLKCIKIQNCLQWGSMEGLENHEELVSINHDFIHKSEVEPLSYRGKFFF